MNIVRELLKKHDVQQKQLAIEIGVSNPTVSDWVHNRKDPSGKNLKKLAEFFGVDELEILGMKMRLDLFKAEDPKTSGKSETDQIIERLLKKLDEMPKTAEARIVSGGMDKLPKEQREKLLNVFTVLYPDLIEGEESKDET